MTTSTATTEFDAREALRQHFEMNALTAFDNCIEFLRQRDFYLHALNKIKQGVDLTGELPELKLVKKSDALKICRQLAKDAEKSATKVWDLSAALKMIFNATIKFKIDPMSLQPCCQVMYKSKVAANNISINVISFRRNVLVVVDGENTALESIYSQIVMAGMRG